MNAAIRAVVRAGLAQGWEVYGVRRGFQGLIDDDLIPMTARMVGGIMQHGGTILQTARSDLFKEERGRLTALRTLNNHDVDALIVIGGNGSQAGSLALWRMGYPVVGVASTIDNDLPGTDVSIGVDTALNRAVEAIDRIKDTASSHQRAFFVEVMGRKSGYLALMVGIAGGAEMVVIPEVETTPQEVAREVRDAYLRGKPHAIVVVAEGATCNMSMLMSYLADHRDEVGFEARATVLGHIQRGGAPTAFDRILATRLGVAAVEALAQGVSGVLCGQINGQIQTTPLEQVYQMTKTLDTRLLAMANVLAR